MIVEERIYTLYMGKTAEYLQLYGSFGYPVQVRYLPKLLGYFTTEVGPLNQVVHLWAYESFEDRRRRRAELLADPDFQDYVARIRPLVQSQENKLLRPAPMSPPIIFDEGSAAAPA
jgi:hypothetical protein